MKYTAVIKTASDISSFIQTEMLSLGAKPGKASVAILFWRLSNTSIGEEIIKSYRRAMQNPDLWRETAAIILQNLSGLLRTVRDCSDGIDEDQDSPDKTRLKIIVKEAANICRTKGYRAADLFGYIEECRNIYVHSGIMPYIIDSESDSIGLNDFLRHKFDDDLTVLESLRMGISAFNSKGDNRKFRSLCNLILSALAFYFDSLKPNLSEFTPIRFVGLYLAMTFHAVATAIKYTIGAVIYAVAGGLSLVRLALKACVILFIAVVVLLISSKIIGFISGSSEPHAFTEVQPAQLNEWVDEMSPFEQMLFLKHRKSALSACNIRHAIGDEVLCSADSVTESLYTRFKDYPDPTSHPFVYLLPNPGHLARIPIYGWVLNKQYGEKIFSSVKPSDNRQTIPELPVYDGNCYPVLEIYSKALPSGNLATISKNIAKYPKLNVMILSAAATASGNNSESAELAKNVRQFLIKNGVRARNIRIVPDMTKTAGVTVAIEGVSNYTAPLQ